MKRDRFRLFLGYMSAVCMLLIFALFCSGRVGWFLMIALIGAPIVSILFTRLFVYGLVFSFQALGNELAKGESCKIQIKMTNKMWLPSPLVKAKLVESPHLRPEVGLLSMSALPKQTLMAEVTYQAKMAGGSWVGLEEIRVWDYFGLVSFSLDKQVGDQKKTWLIGVIPEPTEVSGELPVLQQTMQAAYGSGDAEETLEEASPVFGGFPGYEYREYVPGDPLKRINSKLSAKRGQLLVRLDDKMAVSTIGLILDPMKEEEVYQEPGKKKNARSWKRTELQENALAFREASYEEACLEQYLGMGLTLLSRDFAVNFWVPGPDGWQCYSATEEGQLVELARSLSSFRPQKDWGQKWGRFPQEAAREGSILFVTTRWGDQLAGQLALARQMGAEHLIIYLAATGEGRSLG